MAPGYTFDLLTCVARPKQGSLTLLLSTTISSTSHSPFYFMSDFLFSPLPCGIFPHRIISLLPILPHFFLIFSFSLCKYLLPPQSLIFLCILCILSSLSTLKPISPNLIVQAASPLGSHCWCWPQSYIRYVGGGERARFCACVCVRHTREEGELCPSMMKHTLGWMQVHSSPCSQASIHRGWWNVPIKEERMRKKKVRYEWQIYEWEGMKEWGRQSDEWRRKWGNWGKKHRGQRYDRVIYVTKKRKMGNDSKLERKDFWNNYGGEKG